MVPLNIDFYRLGEEIKKEMLIRLEKIEINTSPLESAWLLYGLCFENRESNVYLEKGVYELEKWVRIEFAGKKDRDLAPLSLCYYLTKNNEIKEVSINKIKEILNRITGKTSTKFTVLNDPEQIFCLSLVKRDLSEELKNKVTENIKKIINGRIARKVLLTASLFELNQECNVLQELRDIENLQDIEEVILILWLFERYREKKWGDPIKIWKNFEDIYHRIDIRESAEGIYLSNRNLSFLYEALLKEIKEPNPNMIFDLYPIHPEIKRVSEFYFKNKKYVTAVLEATKKLNEKIKQVSEIIDKDEVSLIQATMKQISSPQNVRIQFNEFLDEDSGKNEQTGLALISEGIFKAFRNPKGHKPEDHPMLEMNPYEALSQLIIINYIWNRIEKAKIVKR